MVQLEELGQLKNPLTFSGIKPVTFWFVAFCLNQLRYHMPLFLCCAYGNVGAMSMNSTTF
jgi:hypothetical protein